MKAIQIGQDIDYKVFVRLTVEVQSLIDNKVYYTMKQIYDINFDCFDDIDSFELAHNINKYSKDIINIIDNSSFKRKRDKITHVSYGIMDEESLYWKTFDNEEELIAILNNRF